MIPLLALLAASPPCDLVLTGRVLDASTGEALPRAQVAVEGGPSVTTDETGHFALDGLCPGEILLRASRADYEPRAQTLELRANERRDLLLVPYRVTRVDDVIVEAPRLGVVDPRSTTKIDGDALERARGKALADAIADVPGVSVLRSGGTSKPIVRGLSGARLPVLYDGVRHESQDWGLEHGTEVDPFSAGSISVIRGAGGVRYGPDAIAGLMLIEPPAMLSEPGLRAELHTVGALNGRRGTIAARVDAAPRGFEDLAFRVEGNFSKGRALETPDYSLQNTGIEEWNFGAAARWNHDPFSLRVSYSHHDLTSGVCACLRKESAEDFRAQLARDRPLGSELYRAEYVIDRPFQEVTHDRAIARAKLDVEALGTVELTYAFQVNARREYDVVRSSVSGPQFDFDLRTHSVEAALEHSTIALGPTMALSGRGGVMANLQDNVFQGLPLIPNHRSFEGGIYLVERLSLGALELEAGARYEHAGRSAYLDEGTFRRHVARGTLTEADCTLTGDVARCPTSFDVVSASIGAVHHLTEWLDAKLDLSRTSRVPTVDEQYANGTAPSLPVLAFGSPSLGPETSWGASTSLDVKTSWISGEVSAFASFIDDYIVFAPELGPDGAPIIDVVVRGAFPRFSHRAVNAVLYGGETNATLRFQPFELALQAALVLGRDVQNDAFLTFIPPGRARAALTWHAPDVSRLSGSYVSVEGSGVARQDRFDPNADLTQPPDAYFLLGASAGTSLTFDDHELGISLEASNLLNTRYRDYTSLLRYFADEPGRQIVLRVRATFEP